MNCVVAGGTRSMGTQMNRRTKMTTALSVLVAVLMAAGCGAESPEKQLASAKDYLQKNEPKAATIQIKNALQADPNLAEARFLLGTILLEDGNASAAEIEFRKARTAKYPDNLVVPELARTLLMTGQAQKVVEEFAEAKFDQPAANASLQTSLAAAYASLGKPELAQAALSAALAADPGYAPAVLASARQKAASRDFDGALAATEAVIAKDATNPEAWKLKGDILLYANNNADGALTAYRKSIEVDPKFGPGHMATFALLMRQSKLDEATKQLEQIKALAPKSLQTKYYEALLAYQKRDFKLARDLSQQLVTAASNNPLILQLAGAVELQLNSPAQAEIYLTRAIQAAPQLAFARRLLITTYLRSGQPAKALAALNAAIGKDGIDPALLALAGEVYLQNGDAKNAEEAFSKAVKLDPGNAGKRTALALAHLASGQTDVALEELQGIAGTDSGTTADLALISAHLRRNELDKALAAIDKLEAKQPDRPIAANLRGRIQLAQKNTAAARKSFERALAIDPNFFAATASLAALDVADKKPDDAKARFEALLAKNPKNGQALLALAELAAYRGAGKDEVAGLLAKAVEANPTDLRARLLLIELYLRTNDIEQATSAAQSAVAALPQSPEALDALGRAQQASGDLNQALATFGKLATMQPLSPQPYMRMASAQIAAKNYLAAEQSLRKALEIQPDLLEAQRGLILLAVEAKRYPDAVKIARVVQEQRPKSQVGYQLEGDVASTQKNWEAAAGAYRVGLQRAPSTDLAIKLHAALIALGKPADSDKFAAMWRKEYPKDAAFVAYLGEVALAQKDYAAAEKNYLAVLRLQPDSAVALNNLAWITDQLGKEGAIAYAEKANALAPNQPGFMDTLAMLLAEKKEYAKAIELEKKALELQPESAGFRLNLAKIYIKAGDKGKAKIELEALAKLGEKFPGQTEVSALMKSLPN